MNRYSFSAFIRNKLTKKKKEKREEKKKYVVLMSNYNRKYVRYVNESGIAHGYLRCAGEEVTSPYVKLEMVPAESGEGGLIHLRSCYNNKYVVRKENFWASASANRPEEDKSAAAKCTLFRLDFIQSDDSDKTVVRLFHVASGCNACLWRVAPPLNDCLLMGHSEPDQSSCDVFTVIDYDSLATLGLPKHIVLMSNYNDKYVRYVSEIGEAQGYLRCAGEDVISAYAKLEVVPAGCDGLIHLRSCYNGKYIVREESGWASATANNPEEDRSNRAKCTMFLPDFIQNNDVNDKTVLRLVHVATGYNACLWRVGPPLNDCLLMGYSDPDQSSCDVFTVIDYDSLVILGLPKHIVLMSTHNDRYMRYENERGKAQGHLRCSGEDVISPYGKLEVVPAESQEEKLIHLRSCYNNKYVVREETGWASATADKPNEDRSNPAKCTLFRPDVIQKHDAKKIVLQLHHVATGCNAFCWRAAPPYNDCLRIQRPEPNQSSWDVFTVTDWDSLAILPRHVAFKGCNGKYLRAWISREGYRYLQFDGGDITNSEVWNTVNTLPDGRLRIVSDVWGLFWRRSPNWIWADSNDRNIDNPDTVFTPVKVDDNTIALINNGNNCYCVSLATEGRKDCLNAHIPNMRREAMLQVEEVVKSRKIYNVQFRVADAIIYDEHLVTMASTQCTNKRTQGNTTAEMKLVYVARKSRTWNSSVSIKLGAKISVTSGVPEVASAGIEISSEIETDTGWGETVELTSELSVTHTVEVMPMSKTTVSLIATRGSYNVPFSYTQRDTLLNGETVVYKMDDGLFTGVEAYKFHIDTTEEKVDP